MPDVDIRIFNPDPDAYYKDGSILNIDPTIEKKVKILKLWLEHVTEVLMLYKLYDIIFVRFGEVEDVDEVEEMEYDEERYKAQCWARYEYRQIHLKIDIARIKVENLREFIRHELIHAVNEPIQSAGYDITRTKGEEEQIRKNLELVTMLWEGMDFWDIIDWDVLQIEKELLNN